MSAHHGHHHHHHEAGDRKVFWAILVNLALTVAQIVGGVLAGSLSLIADALHNFSDAISLIIAFAARRIARRPPDETMTFGYARAEVVAALINYTTLIVVGLYLVYEAMLRFYEPEPVAGWMIVIIAAVALAIDLVTAALTYTLSKESMNIRAAFLHNVADALGSVAVIVAGTIIILSGWDIVDPIVTILIAGYILWMAFTEIGGTIRLLMLAAPVGTDIRELVAAMEAVDGVEGVHHLHLWQIDENDVALEAHVVTAGAGGHEPVKRALKALLRERFGVSHATLEFESGAARCDGPEAAVIGHRIGADHDRHH